MCLSWCSMIMPSGHQISPASSMAARRELSPAISPGLRPFIPPEMSFVIMFPQSIVPMGRAGWKASKSP